MKLDKKIIEYLAPFKKDISRFLKAVKNYDRIAVFRHATPDYDALGSQFGLATWLKDNFPNKDVCVLGDNHVTYTNRVYPKTDKIDEDWFKTPFLAIILDVANLARISDPRYKNAEFIIKIDHHPEIEKFGDISIVNVKACATAEMITNMLLSLKGHYVLSKKAASYLYSAIAGDSGRFQYSSTSQVTFITAAYLLEIGIDITEIYQTMYLRQIDDLKIMGYIIDNFKTTKNGVAYYLLPDKVLKELNITTERGKENVNLFSNIEGIEAWCSITEDIKDNCWRISLRSKEKPINELAARWGGGGHALASGARLNNISELDKFIGELEALFTE
ncbi:MAG TPA: bifunctional oligoribonuclease/PAP phosphatase NrnA [Erysipelotrichaceae bacterium]|nr:bifunctional oligoribonuclease/PAP phosphatase NrnA [Erysipelotrichaceae bacterium]